MSRGINNLYAVMKQYILVKQEILPVALYSSQTLLCLDLQLSSI